MTFELAQRRATVPAMDGLLERRLDRLRQTPERPATSLAPSTDHAAALARAVDGRVATQAGGRVVIVESRHAVALDVRRLATLPYPIDVSRPLVCLDVETTGLGTAAGTLAFLVGVGTFEDGLLTVRQYLLPDHAAEPALLTLLAAALPADAWLVTYNGVSFDWPLLVARYRLHRRSPPPLAGQLDLLPVARQLWRHRLTDARLATVEAGICGVRRTADLPGSLVPERYFAYLRSRDGALLRDVVEHNRLDIVSLGLLMSQLARDMARRERWGAAHPGDLAGLGRAFARRQRVAESLDVVEAALSADAWQVGVAGGGPLRRRLAGERARLLGRLGRRQEAFAAWLEIAHAGGPGAAAAWLRVARVREHVEHDYSAALEACRYALAMAERARLWGPPLSAIERDLRHRMVRLRRRQALSPVDRRAA